LRNTGLYAGLHITGAHAHPPPKKSTGSFEKRRICAPRERGEIEKREEREEREREIFATCIRTGKIAGFPTHRLYLGGPPRYINGRQSIIREPFRFHFFNPSANTTASAIPRTSPHYRVKGLLYALRTVTLLRGLMSVLTSAPPPPCS